MKKLRGLIAALFLFVTRFAVAQSCDETKGICLAEPEGIIKNSTHVKGFVVTANWGIASAFGVAAFLGFWVCFKHLREGTNSKAILPGLSGIAATVIGSIYASIG